MIPKDIFISYRNDGVGNNFASRLANDLKSCGYSVFINSAEARSGDFPERLRKAISGCKDFICIVTDDYIKQLKANNDVCWIRDELLCAEENHKNIVPILINDTVMPSNASEMPEELQFFPNIDAYVFPEQYMNSPFSDLCGILISRNNGTDSMRDVYNSSELFDADQVLEDLLEKAESGDMKSMITAGIYYYYGISGGKNDRKAAKWFKKVSEEKCEYSSIANKCIAGMYYAGVMPREPQSYEKSYLYHSMAAEFDKYSAGQVGFAMSVGSGCEFDYEKVEKYYLDLWDVLDNPRKDTLCRFYRAYGEFEKAAKIYETMVDTYPEAAYQLGLMYKRGVLSKPYKPDYFKAANYFQMALENGYTSAAHELGTLHFNPTGGFKKDFVKAQKYFRISADAGYAEAQYILGYMYNYGHVEKNDALAIECFEKAAAQGHMLSAAMLALLYQKPEHHNYEKAFNYCKYAADCGDTPSEFVLGTLYLLGRGCEADEDKAYMCFERAAENGLPEAKLLLDQMEQMDL